MQSSNDQVSDVLGAVFRRRHHLRILPPSSQAFLEHNNQCYMDCPGQKERDEYRDFLSDSGIPVSNYRALRQLFDQLAYAANADERYFTFRDTGNCSSCLSPRISLGGYSEQQTLQHIRSNDRSNGATGEESFYGMCAWQIHTTDPEMARALTRLPDIGPYGITRTETGEQYNYWLMEADNFFRLRDLIIQYQGAFILPFKDDAAVQLRPRLPTRQQLDQLHTVKDAWL